MNHRGRAPSLENRQLECPSNPRHLTVVYWFDGTDIGQCRVPQSWMMQYLAGGTWKPVSGSQAIDHGTAPDTFPRIWI